MSKNYYSDYATTDSGKFRLKAVMTAGSGSAGMSIALYAHVSDAFKSAHTASVICYKNNTTKLEKTKKNIKKAGTYKLGTFTVNYGKVSKAIKLTINKKTVVISANTILNSADKMNITTVYPFAISVNENIYRDDESETYSVINATKPTLWNITVRISKGELDQPVNKIYLESTNVLDPQDSDWSEVAYDTFSYTSNATQSSFNVSIDFEKPYKFRARASGSSSGTEKFSSFTYSPQLWSMPDATQSVSISNIDDVNYVIWEASLTSLDDYSVRDWLIYQKNGLNGTWQYLATVEADESVQSYSYAITKRLGNLTQYFKVVARNYLVETSDENTSSDEGYVSYILQEAWASAQIEADLVLPPSTPSINPNSMTYYWNSNATVTITVNSTDFVEGMSAHIESSLDGETWTEIAEITYPTKSYTDSSATTTTQYRVRFENDGGYSDYSEAFQPGESIAPEAPILVSPLTNYFFYDDSSVNLVWAHQTVDGSPQIDAEIYRGNTLVADNLGSATSYNLSYTMWVVGTHTIKIRTKGANGLWSPFAIYVIQIVRRPWIEITEPTGTVSTLPLTLTFFAHGSLERVNVRILDEDGNEVFTTEKTYITPHSEFDSISLMGLLFEPDVQYMIYISGQFDYGIASQQTSIVVEYDEDADLEGALYAYSEEDNNAIAYVTIGRDEEESAEPLEVIKAYLYRDSNGENVLIGEVNENDTITDLFAPVNIQYQYKLLQLFEDGTAATVITDTMIPSNYSYIYWGNNYANIIRAIWNPQISNSINRPEKQLVRYSGRNYPVSYDSKARDEKSTFTAQVEYATLEELIKFMNAGGSGIWKSVQGRCYSASFDMNWQRVDAQYPVDLYDVTLQITRTGE